MNEYIIENPIIPTSSFVEALYDLDVDFDSLFQFEVVNSEAVGNVLLFNQVHQDIVFY